MKFTSINLLDELAKPEFSEFLSVFRERTFARQTIIFEPTYDDDLQGGSHPTAQTQPADCPAGSRPYNYVFIVRTGRIRVYLSYGGKEFTIAVLRPGDVYVSHSNAFVQTLESSSIMLTDTETFNRRMMSVPQFTLTVVRVLGGMLKNTFSIIDGLTLRDVSTRLARFLLEAARNGDAQQDMVHLDVSVELLAQTLGASRQTVSTLLTDLTRAMILYKERRGVYRILDEDRLRELAVLSPYQ